MKPITLYTEHAVMFLKNQNLFSNGQIASNMTAI